MYSPYAIASIQDYFFLSQDRALSVGESSGVSVDDDHVAKADIRSSAFPLERDL